MALLLLFATFITSPVMAQMGAGKISSTKSYMRSVTSQETKDLCSLPGQTKELLKTYDSHWRIHDSLKEPEFIAIKSDGKKALLKILKQQKIYCGEKAALLNKLRSFTPPDKYRDCKHFASVLELSRSLRKEVKKLNSHLNEVMHQFTDRQIEFNHRHKMAVITFAKRSDKKEKISSLHDERLDIWNSAEESDRNFFRKYVVTPLHLESTTLGGYDRSWLSWNPEDRGILNYESDIVESGGISGELLVLEAKMIREDLTCGK